VASRGKKKARVVGEPVRRRVDVALHSGDHAVAITIYSCHFGNPGFTTSKQAISAIDILVFLISISHSFFKLGVVAEAERAETRRRHYLNAGAVNRTDGSLHKNAYA
jgi:hypothetical protein